MTKFGQENSTTEFKRQLSDALEKEVVAFLNSAKGGDLYIGVDDDGEVLGVSDVDAQMQAIRDGGSSLVLTPEQAGEILKALRTANQKQLRGQRPRPQAKPTAYGRPPVRALAHLAKILFLRTSHIRNKRPSGAVI